MSCSVRAQPVTTTGATASVSKPLVPPVFTTAAQAPASRTAPAPRATATAAMARVLRTARAPAAIETAAPAPALRTAPARPVIARAVAEPVSLTAPARPAITRAAPGPASPTAPARPVITTAGRAPASPTAPARAATVTAAPASASLTAPARPVITRAAAGPALRMACARAAIATAALGTCVANGTCSSGYHESGAGTCVLNGSCASGYHTDGSGACVRNQCENGTTQACGSCSLGTQSCASNTWGTCSGAPNLQTSNQHCGACNSPCATGRTCSVGVCKSPNGGACNTNADCVNNNCTTFYFDADNDSYGSATYGTSKVCGTTAPGGNWRSNNLDCCDGNFNVSRDYNDGPRDIGAENCPTRPFDWNCDGVEKPTYRVNANGCTIITTEAECSGGVVIRTATACGAVADQASACGWDGSTCTNARGAPNWVQTCE